MRSLGQFVGHLTHAVKANPAKDDTADASTEKREVRREVEEREEIGPDGRKVTLRRTTVEEIEIQPTVDPKNAPGKEETKGDRAP